MMHENTKLKSRAVLLLPLWAFVACSRVTFTFTSLNHLLQLVKVKAHFSKINFIPTNVIFTSTPPFSLHMPRLFRRVRKIAKRLLLVPSCLLSVCPSAWNNSASTGGIFMNFNISGYFEILSRKTKFN